jgi:hypothetical protein
MSGVLESGIGGCHVMKKWIGHHFADMPGAEWR